MNKLHPELDKLSYRIVFDVPQLDAIKKAPPTAHRLAIVHDEDNVMMFVDLDELRTATEAQVFQVVKF